MIQSDYLLRQVRHLAQALAQVLFRKQAGALEEAQEMLANALQEGTGLSLGRLRQLDQEGLLGLCVAGGALQPEKAVALADLLQEDVATEGRERALWLYEAVLQAGGAVPLDVWERMEALRASLGEGSPDGPASEGPVTRPPSTSDRR